MTRLLDKLSSFANEIGIWMFFIMMLLIAAAVVARYFFLTAIPGSIEIVQLLQVIAVGLCLGFTQKIRANVSVDLFVGMMPPRIKALLAVVNAAVAVALFALVSYGIVKIASTTGAMRETTDTHGLALYPFKWLLGAGFAILTLQLLADFLRAVSAFIGGKELSDPHSAHTNHGSGIDG